MIDYCTPRIPIRLAATAAGFNVNTLRSLYERKRFRVVGGEQAKARGLGHSLNLLDTLHIALAKRLMDIGVDPYLAFEHTIGAIHTGEAGRDPGQTFDQRALGFTAFIYFPGSGATRMVATRNGLSFDQWAIDPYSGQRSTAVTLFYNDVERAVFAVLQEAGEL